MDRKMRGIADPYTLGIVIAFVGTLLAYTFIGHGEELAAKKVELSVRDTSNWQL